MKWAETIGVQLLTLCATRLRAEHQVVGAVDVFRPKVRPESL